MLKSVGILFLCGGKKKGELRKKKHEYKMNYSYVFQMNCPQLFAL